ncbi:hypothetical protein ACLKA7_017386 [Drosophila subpalustris]
MKKKTEKPISDEEESIADESAESDDESEMDLEASATESDEDDAESESESDAEQKKTATKSRAEIIEEQVHSKYEQLKGTRLYVRFPQKLPLDDQEFDAKVKALHPQITKATKPRQKHARFCLVEFKSQEDRDAALADIKASIASDEAFKGIYVSLPKTDSDEFVTELVARKQQSLEKKKNKSLIKRATKQVQRKDIFTSSVVITNLPKTASVAQVRKLFENAVDIQIKPGKGKFRDFSAATVTLPTTYDARRAIKQDLNISGSKLLLRFNTKQQQQQKRRSKQNLKRKPSGKEIPPKVASNKKAKKTVEAN